MFECELCGRCSFTEELAQFLLVSVGQAKIMNAIDRCLRVFLPLIFKDASLNFLRGHVHV